jgi:hypothetical protein
MTQKLLATSIPPMRKEYTYKGQWHGLPLVTHVSSTSCVKPTLNQLWCLAGTYRVYPTLLALATKELICIKPLLLQL